MEDLIKVLNTPFNYKANEVKEAKRTLIVMLRSQEREIERLEKYNAMLEEIVSQQENSVRELMNKYMKGTKR